MNTCKNAIDSEACRKCQGRYCATKISIFENLEECELKEITDSITRRHYDKDEMIFFEGDKPEKLFLLNKGRVKVFKYNKEGREQIIYILTEGDFIGDSNIFSGEEMKFNAVAIEETNICELTKSDFEDIMKRNPEIAMKILQNAYHRIDKLQELIQSLSTKDIESRIAGLLLSFIKDFGTPDKNGIIIELPLNREDIANYIGVTRETISRKLGALQDQGILGVEGNRQIRILDLDLLEEKYYN